MISIIIPTYNHCNDLLKPCIKSVLDNTDMDNAEIVVVANGCTDNTKEYLDGLNNPKIRTLWYDEPLGFPKAINEGLRSLTSETSHTVLLNNDCVLIPQPRNLWIDILLNLFKDPDVGIAGPLRLYDNYVNQYYIHFFIAMVKNEVIKKIGFLDEIFGDGNCEDTDYCIRAKLNGYKIANVQVVFDKKTTMKFVQFPIYHIAHATVGGIKDFNATIQKNLVILQNRYKYLLPEQFEAEDIR